MDICEKEVKAENIRKIILNTKVPLRIKNTVKCDLISWNLKDWEALLKDDILQFRCGKYQYTTDPQWETKCLNKMGTFQEFLDKADSNVDEWWYFDYKYLCEWFTDKEVLREKIDWSLLGFPEVTVNESTIWIGSKGAHTSCHMDTYGCNLILQVYGRKQWILFPPEQNLKPTRIPFEESSIYSKLNFFSPKEENFKGISQCHKIILNPGDVLVLPYKWWHYVENLETAISINTWLPMPQDDLERIKESIATIFVGQLAQNQDDCKSYILNPNMIEEMVTCDQALYIINALLQKCKPTNENLKVNNQAIKNQDNEDIDILMNKYECISKIPILSEEDFKLFLQNQVERFLTLKNCEEGNNKLICNNLTDLLEVITDDEVLSLIAKKLIEKR